MRKAPSYLVLLLTCAACGGTADDSKTSSGDHSESNAVTPAPGVGEESEAASGAPIGATSATPPSGPSLGAGSTASAGGAAGGGLAAGTVGGGVPPATPAFGGAASFPVATPVPPPGPTMPVFPSSTPTPQGGQLTAAAWDDNMNYTRFTQFRSDVTQRFQGGILPFTSADFDAAYEKFSKPRAAHTQLDVALVIDTTGSMGDEIAYLQREFSDLSTAIESAYPMAAQRWALIVYKDVGDVYVTREYDFRSDLNALRADLAAQSAGGGGDFPEAPETAFEQLNQFQWRAGAEVARLAFWVADAPHHNHRAMAMADALRATQGLDVHVYPVASSGIDEFTELAMRSSAQLTGGRYLFLTNDSGIGGNHKEPSIPCYFVTRLDHAILRMIKIEMTGMHSEPEMAQILRTGGNPKDGACTLSSGVEVEVF
jgi:hypothetical protein